MKFAAHAVELGFWFAHGLLLRVITLLVKWLLGVPPGPGARPTCHRRDSPYRPTK